MKIKLKLRTFTSQTVRNVRMMLVDVSLQPVNDCSLSA